MTKEVKTFLLIVFIFLIFYFVPFSNENIHKSLIGGFEMLHDYAREHVLLCLVPAFFIAGTIAVFVSKNAILKLLGPKAKKIIAYPVAAVSGGILAVCSCTILPLFGGIYKRGAGIGPAMAFLFTGPAINVAAIFLTGTVLGWELSFVRLLATIISAVFIGLIMQTLFKETGEGGFVFGQDTEIPWQKTLLFLAFQMAFLITGSLKIYITLKSILMTIFALVSILIALTFDKEHQKEYISETWDFTKKILPYLFIGVFIAGIISVSLPKNVVQTLLGGNRLFSNLFASVFGALMYFATLTEVPIIQSLMSLGMGKGPALALFMAGYTLSLPNMIVLTKLLGKKKAFTYFVLVIFFSTTWGLIYGNLF
ncbi:permease [Marinitoga aeolica]|uniref:Permease n=1 Tax=Marinitoga aeolica TaxID=2809031 RepID=A0ABY8PSU2_9BACT|nr:permease [Marinitoga aeolica]WGS65706.1 permease [Marinitoga aeolica]